MLYGIIRYSGKSAKMLDRTYKRIEHAQPVLNSLRGREVCKKWSYEIVEIHQRVIKSEDRF